MLALLAHVLQYSDVPGMGHEKSAEDGAMLSVGAAEDSKVAPGGRHQQPAARLCGGAEDGCQEGSREWQGRQEDRGEGGQGGLPSQFVSHDKTTCCAAPVEARVSMLMRTAARGGWGAQSVADRS